jgi:3',5'-cyclic AMP phosphodiesterase CpdA
LPVPLPAAGPGYYSVQLATWRLISLDSNLGPAAQAAQLAWLRAELARHRSRRTLAYWHHPLYSSGMNGNIAHMKDAWQALYEAGAELVPSGHNHVDERFAPQDADGRRDEARGMRQLVVGTGGAFAAPLLRARAKWEFAEAQQDAPPAGWRPDRGAGRCH